jgi:DNA-binding IscR family transcriptional regulator
MHGAWTEAQDRMMSVLDGVSLERLKADAPVG